MNDHKQYRQPNNGSSVGATIASTSTSLFSSLKGGAESLFKNIKENFKNPDGTMGGITIPRRPSIPVGSENDKPSAPPAPRPPLNQPPPRPTAPKPIRKPQEPGMGTRVQENHSESQSMHPPPLPDKPAVAAKQEQPMFVENLLDLGDFGGGAPAPSDQTQSSSAPKHDGFMEDMLGREQGNADLLDDLFGGASNKSQNQNQSQAPLNVDLLGSVSSGVDSFFGDMGGGPAPMVFGEYSKPEPVAPVPSVILNKKSNDLLDDLFGDASTTTKSTDSSAATTGHIPSSSSFGSLFQLKPERAAPTGGMVKNVSTPNLTDLILEDTKPPRDPVKSVPPAPSKPNYNRAVFEVGTGTNPNAPNPKKDNLNDLFGEFLKSEGFSSSSANGKNQTINDLRRVEMVRDSQDPIQLKISLWREGKKKNIRALLASLHTITWEGCNWTEVGMSQMITDVQVKKVYRKACLCIHPDKQVGNDQELLAKAIFVELNEAWAAFEADK
jgi:cyclin G-associated kinase